MKLDKKTLIEALLSDIDSQYVLSKFYYRDYSTEKEVIFSLNQASKRGNLKALNLLQEINTNKYLLHKNENNKDKSLLKTNLMGGSHAYTCA